MRSTAFTLALLIALSMSIAAGCRTPKGESVEEKRNYALQMRQETLAELFKEHPEAEAHIARAPGHAVFSSLASKILMVATGSGFGVATDNKTGKHTYMRMVEAGGGFGMGIKVYKAVYIFDSRDAFDAFLDGSWQAGADADVGAQYEEKGAEVGVAMTTDQVAKPVTVYQFTEKGVALSATATGMRYFPDKDLN